MNHFAKQPVDFDFGDDLGVSQVADNQAEIRDAAHVVNGGNSSAFPCPNCRGTGEWRSGYSCFKCDGSGKISARKLGAIKAKATRSANVEAWQEEHAELIAALRGMTGWNTFAASLIESLETYGTLRENQVAAARTMLAKVAAKREEKKAEKQTTLGGALDVSRIEQLFSTARDNGLSKLKFRTEHIEISVPKSTSRNAGGLYVIHDGVYAGKIMGGKFIAGFDAKPDTLALVCDVASDPIGKAKQYGVKTGVCSCCGRELSDPVSVAAGIGPICADNWGL